MTRLRSCEACSRHVFVTETRCPFCAAALAPVVNSPIFNIKAGMSRAQRFTLVAAVAGQTLLGCSDDPKTGLGDGSQQGASGTGGAAANAGSGGSSSGGSSGGGVAQPVYGAPVTPVGTAGMAVYGAPFPVDAAVAADAGDPKDAGLTTDAGDSNDAGPASDAGIHDGGPRIQPVYGAPIPLYGLPPVPEK